MHEVRCVQLNPHLLLQRAVLLLFCISAFFAIQTSLGLAPYSHLAPKKVAIQHLQEYDSSGQLLRSVFAIGAVDSVPVDNLLTDKRPDLWAAQKNGWEWLVAPLPGHSVALCQSLGLPLPEMQN